MPLSAKARIEIYLPDLPKAEYKHLLTTLDRELTYTFGGCTIVPGLDGSYLSSLGVHIRDRVSLIYTDAPLAFGAHRAAIARYADELKTAIHEALEEEAVLIVAFEVHHAD